MRDSPFGWHNVVGGRIQHYWVYAAARTTINSIKDVAACGKRGRSNAKDPSYRHRQCKGCQEYVTKMIADRKAGK